MSVERLNNIINELEKEFDKELESLDYREEKLYTQGIHDTIINHKCLLQELKGSNEPSFEEMVGFVENVCKDIKSQPTLHEELEDLLNINPMNMSYEQLVSMQNGWWETLNLLSEQNKENRQLKEQLQQKENIIKEVREYINDNVMVYAFNDKKFPHWDFNDDNINDILEILAKENKQ